MVCPGSEDLGKVRTRHGGLECLPALESGYVFLSTNTMLLGFVNS